MNQPIIEFIREQFSTKEFIPLHAPSFIGSELKYLTECIDSTFVSSVGKFVDSFEKQLSIVTNTKRAIAVVNGTSALQITLNLIGVKNGDEVITQALTFVATANAIHYCNATPVFLDVDLDTMGLSPDAVKAFLNQYGEIREDGCYNKRSGNKISACVPMHTFGFPVHIEELMNVCKEWGIPLIEDAAESLGSFYKGKPLGSLGTFGAFSFNGNKIITSGGGGAIVTNDVDLAERAKFLTTTAKQPHPYEYYHPEIGYNFRMPNINAALALAQLEKLNEFLENKRELALTYQAYFTSKGIKFRTENKDTCVNYWLMAIELDNKIDRDQFLKETNNQGVMTRPIWALMHRLPMYQKCVTDSLKNSKYLEERIVNIPSSYRK